MLANSVSLAADTTLKDDTIIRNVLDGNIDHYEILVRRYNSQLYKAARGILDNEDDIEDVMQEAYINGFKKLNQFRGEAKFSTWITRILINCALQQVNKLKKNQRVSLEDATVEEMEMTDYALTETSQMEIEANLKNALEKAIAHLPPKYRLAFILREVEQIPVSEVAAILNISEENVKIRSHRARIMLRKILTPKLPQLDILEFHANRCTRIAGAVMQALRALNAH